MAYSLPYNLNECSCKCVTAPAINSSITGKTAVKGVAFSYTITGTYKPTSYDATGLPAGLSVNKTTGVISGTPTTAGTSNVTISASNVTGTGSATLKITIAEAPVLANWLRITLTWGRPGNIISYLYINELNASTGIRRYEQNYLCDFGYVSWSNPYIRYNEMVSGKYQTYRSGQTNNNWGSDGPLDLGRDGKIVYDINLNEYKKLGKPWIHAQISGYWYYLLRQLGYYYPDPWPTVQVTATYYDRDPIRTVARTSYDWYGRPYQNDYKVDDPAAKIALPGKQASGGCNRAGSYLTYPSCSSTTYYNSGQGPYATYIMSPLHVAASGNIMISVDFSNDNIYIF